MTPTPPTRTDILSAMWQDYGELKEVREAVKEGKKQPTNALRFQVYCLQTAASLCRGIIQGLSEQEFELRVLELESKLQNSILIPKQTQETKKF